MSHIEKIVIKQWSNKWNKLYEKYQRNIKACCYWIQLKLTKKIIRGISACTADQVNNMPLNLSADTITQPALQAYSLQLTAITR